MPPLYLVVKFVHVATAIVALGSSAGLGVWLELGPHETDKLAFLLKGIRRVEAILVVPGYFLMLASGLAMVYLAPWSITRTPWLIAALVLWGVGLVLFGGALVALHRQLALVEARDTGSPRYARVAFASRALGALAGLVVLVIAYLMIVKPTL